MIADLTYLRGGIDWPSMDPDARNEAHAAWLAMQEWASMNRGGGRA